MKTRQRGQPESTKPLIRLSRPVYDRLAGLRQERMAELERDVSFTEVIEGLLPPREGARP